MVAVGRSLSRLCAAGGAALLAVIGAAEDPPARVTTEMLSVLDRAPEPGPRITPFLRDQLDRAWAQDDARRRRFEAVKTEGELLALQRDVRARALRIIGGLPEERTPLNPRVTGAVLRDAYRIEKIVFESLPGIHVTALLNLPDAPAGPRPAVLLACGHAPLGKAHPAYQEIAARLARRGYAVLCWDPVGQGERSQYWDAARRKSRYNLVCGEHAVLGNLATLAGTSLVRYMVWDGMRALDYLLTRPEVDGQRIAITGTSGGGFQSLWIGALDPRIRVVLPSCFVTALPMRMANRIFEDPDSDPEQDPPGLVSEGVDHPGLLLLAWPRPVHLAAAVKDFFPIEGTRKTAREVGALYRAFGRPDAFALTEGFHGHQYSPENQAAAFAFLDRAFGNEGSPALAAVETLEADRLRCTVSGQVRTEYPGRSLAEVIRERWRAGRDDRIDLAAVYQDAADPRIREWEVVPLEGDSGPGRIAWRSMGRSEAGDTVIERYLLRHGGALAMPLLHIHGKDTPPRRVVLRTGLHGKVRIEDWPEVEADLRRGDHVVSFDPRGLGETRMRYRAESGDDPALAPSDEAEAYASPVSGVLANHVYNALLTGRPYFLQMIEDAEIAARFARVRLGAERLAVAGEGDDRLLAMAVARVLPGIELLPARSGAPVFSWAGAVEDMRETWPIHYLMPGGASISLEPAGERPR